MGLFAPCISLISRSFRTNYPVGWDTVKFGLLFTGSEWSQQVILKKVWDFDKMKLRDKSTGREDLDWGTIGRLVGSLTHIKILDRKYASTAH